MSKKKPIEIFEEHLDKLATTTVEKDLEKEVDDILNFLYDIRSSSGRSRIESLIEVLVSKEIVSLKDFKRVLGE